MSSRNKQQQTQQQQQSFSNQNTYGWMTPPDTADLQAMRGFQFQADPRVPYAFSRARQNVGATYDSPTSGFMPPSLRDAAMRSQYEDIGQQEGQALREENYARQGLEYARTADVASMTQPRLVNERSSGTSSGTSNSNTNQSQGALGSAIGGASTVGAALLM